MDRVAAVRRFCLTRGGEQHERHGSLRPLLPRDKQKEGRIKESGLALTARATAVLAVYPDSIGVGG